MHSNKGGGGGGGGVTIQRWQLWDGGTGSEFHKD